MNTSGLIAGLCVGVPALVAVLFMVYMWAFNEKKQKKEDSYEIDVGTKDNESFDHFRSELHKPYKTYSKTEQYTPKQEYEDSKKYNYEDSNKDSKHYECDKKPDLSTSDDHDESNVASTSQDSSVSIERPPPAFSKSPSSPNRGMSHAKTGSSYDFYDSFIPVMASNASVDHRDSHNSLANESDVHDTDVASTNRSTNSVPSALHHEKSLDNLAKQLHGPTFFDKLPTRASMQMKSRPSAPGTSSYHSSSTDLAMDGASGINEHYTYEEKTGPHAYSALVASPKSDESPFK